MERTKRAYASVDITELFESNGVIKKFKEIELKKNKSPEEFKNSLDNIPLHYFENTEYESRDMSEWLRLIKQSPEGLPARAYSAELYERNQELNVKISWKSCQIVEYNENLNQFKILFENSSYVQNANEESRGDVHLDRIYFCFDAEDPLLYAERIQDAFTRKETVHSKLALNLYVDSMPVDNLRPLNSTQVNRILGLAVNTDALRTNTALDTATFIQQFNLNHMRTINRLIFINILTKYPSDVNMMHTICSNPELFEFPQEMFPNSKPIFSNSENSFTEKLQSFRFNSLWSKKESISIVYAIQTENFNLEKTGFLTFPDKSMKVEEFNMTMQLSTAALSTCLKETWINAITHAVRFNLKDVKKGWFNIEESSLEVYNFSKLKNFLFRLNFMLEDTLRDTLRKITCSYAKSIIRYCPDKVNVISNELVEISGGKFPLFTVEIKFINPTAGQPAMFVYSAGVETLYDAILAPFDQVFEIFKGIVKLEKRVMKKLFWSHDPVIRVPHSGEDWAVSIREELSTRVKESLEAMNTYLLTLTNFMDLIEIDVKSYAAEAEAKFCPGDTYNLPELCALARKHSAESESVFHMLPSFCSLGFVLIDCRRSLFLVFSFFVFI